MRATVLLAVILPACVGFNSRSPRGGPIGNASPGAGATSMSVPRRGEVEPRWKAVGYSWEGRPLRFARIGHGPRKVLWIGGIHGNEREGVVSTRELPGEFAEDPGLADAVTLLLLEDLNPDGSFLGTRGNARGIDLNRNYPADNFKPNRRFGMHPLDQPESRALHDLVLRERPDLVIVAHSWTNDHFINYDGPAAELAARFSELSGYRVQPSDGIAPTPGSLGSWIGGTLGIPILTLEHQRGRDPWSAWLDTKTAILAVMRAG